MTQANAVGVVQIVTGVGVAVIAGSANDRGTTGDAQAVDRLALAQAGSAPSIVAGGVESVIAGCSRKIGPADNPEAVDHLTKAHAVWAINIGAS